MNAGNCTDESADYHTSGGALVDDFPEGFEAPTTVPPLRFKDITIQDGSPVVITRVGSTEPLAAFASVNNEDDIILTHCQGEFRGFLLPPADPKN